MISELNNCPFCGGNAGIKWTSEVLNMQSVGCMTESMLCPKPSIVAYKVNGEFDYTYWNQRINNK
jgi:hypothetical protein